MFEDLHSLRPDLVGILRRLQPLQADELRIERSRFPGCPEAYWRFVSEIGVGPLDQDGEPFRFEERLRSAEKDYFLDRQIYENGAAGDILVFGAESMGTAYGFDSGRSWALVEVDELRIVTPLSLAFVEFVRGLIVCYPQIPVGYDLGKWVDGQGKTYQIP